MALTFYHGEKMPRNSEIQGKKGICKGTYAEVTPLVFDLLCFHNTELNTLNHSEELKGLKKIKRPQHKT